MLDINIKIVDNQLYSDICHKPTNSFSCQTFHTMNKISLSFARHIIRIATDIRDYRVKELLRLKDKIF